MLQTCQVSGCTFKVALTTVTRGATIRWGSSDIEPHSGKITLFQPRSIAVDAFALMQNVPSTQARSQMGLGMVLFLHSQSISNTHEPKEMPHQDW